MTTTTTTTMKAKTNALEVKSHARVASRTTRMQSVVRNVRCEASNERESERSVKQASAIALCAFFASSQMANANEVMQIAKGDAKSLAAAEFAELQAKKNTPIAASKTKKLAGPGFSLSAPSLSAPSFSLPSFGGAKSAPKAKTAEAAKPKETKSEGSGLNLGFVMAVLFSPLLAVQAVSFQTLARIAGNKK